MVPFLKETYGNASSIHAAGRAAALAVMEARRQVAQALNADPQEIFFTSGGTESDNWQSKAFAPDCSKKGKNNIYYHRL